MSNEERTDYKYREKYRREKSLKINDSHYKDYRRKATVLIFKF